MAIKNQLLEKNFAIYNGDCMEVLKDMPTGRVDLSVYSPPFCGLYNYSSSERDLSNCKDYAEFFDHYKFVVKELARVTKPGRCTAVHCMDIPGSGTGKNARMGIGANAGTGLIDFPGDIIRLHEECGFAFAGRRAVWKEPLGVRLRTMAKGLSHKQLTEDSVQCDVASADYLLMFRNKGENEVPVVHPVGLMGYAGSREIPREVLEYRGHEGKQTENRFSHWIWRQYASSFWDDVRLDRVLPYKESKDPEDERHVHPLQLDVIERAVVLWSNPGEVVFTPFMGVGSEVYAAVLNGRKGVGVELKTAYYKQAALNLQSIKPELEHQELPLDKSEP